MALKNQRWELICIESANGSPKENETPLYTYLLRVLLFQDENYLSWHDLLLMIGTRVKRLVDCDLRGVLKYVCLDILSVDLTLRQTIGVTAHNSQDCKATRRLLHSPCGMALFQLLTS